ncbi:NitT/TauT family transport system ATP-binding protein [Roseimicrobium gellanilyticum]|uniref:NitT/TauT family transport system ATP-binding protein n=1 Tax=Roseimicrobium gellanilyticum TaxID=748857 RepID=A0A366H4P8_9BACT|nr:ATP-binding cassette domain-containing protein [Roseimicrobium gellanilyticum]RBP36889.1 NitT/TauT family transport system ATP-binding protein [Roseimicrobium gellanilyticum]
MSKVPAISLCQVCLSYASVDDGGLFSDFSLALPQAQTTVLMGGSGSGKTTLARMASGRVQPDAGKVTRNTAYTAAHDCVYVDQDAWNSVFPYRTVGQNLAWTLQKLGWQTARATQRIEQLLSAFDMTAKRDAFPKALSGGQRQRLALLRCLLWEPKCMILDESLSALDEATKARVITLLIQEVRQRGMTLIHVTHNPLEALALADVILVIGSKPVRVIGELEGGFQDLRQVETPAFEAAQARLMHMLRTTD